MRVWLTVILIVFYLHPFPKCGASSHDKPESLKGERCEGSRARPVSLGSKGKQQEEEEFARALYESREAAIAGRLARFSLSDDDEDEDEDCCVNDNPAQSPYKGVTPAAVTQEEKIIVPNKKFSNLTGEEQKEINELLQEYFEELKAGYNKQGQSIGTLMKANLASEKRLESEQAALLLSMENIHFDLNERQVEILQSNHRKAWEELRVNKITCEVLLELFHKDPAVMHKIKEFTTTILGTYGVGEPQEIETILRDHLKLPYSALLTLSSKKNIVP